MAERRRGAAGPVRPGLFAATTALAVTAAVLVPAAVGDGGTGTDRPGPRAAPARDDVDSSADTCERPEASLRPSPADGPAIEKIRAAGVVRAGVDQSSFRWGYRDPATGELTGFDIALVKAIAKEILGDEDKVVYKAIPTNRRVRALRDRDVDVVVRTMTINCERAAQVGFSTAYFEAGQQVLAVKKEALAPGEPEITGYDDSLRGRRVCAAEGSTAAAELAKESHGARVVPVPNQLDCLVRLQLGEVDAVVTDNALAAGQAAQDPTVELKGTPFTTELYGVAMHREDEDLIRRVNQVLEEYRAGGRSSPWRKAYDRWLAADLGLRDPVPPRPVYRD
ncbi:glutamate ABC transporter substrate-binding protein [Streptomyces pactum]|uniref:Glutamate ABC transporter substrate-binding protein n=1 Tax=Streptomyces pactum TaxID=68249 RepID=A0ABS0NID3_9ACTN|nr:glutamate ABC transporter substrate-binding protein [Streptomyces pactum]MBH5334877.1 glutamate ABC transporter substrate-binding protein [Streptomyces pactum]